MDSILQSNHYCYLCGEPYTETHHVFFGTANRKLSDADGCVIYVCRKHHELIHRNHKVDLTIKARMQMKWEEVNGKTTEDFRKRYGKSYV